MKQIDLTIGHVYTSFFKGQGNYIFRYTADPADMNWLLERVDGGYTYNKNNGNITESNGFHEFDYPTERQLCHFEQCEEVGIYVPYSPSKDANLLLIF